MDSSYYSNSRHKDDYALFSEDDDYESGSSQHLVSPYRRQLHKSPRAGDDCGLKQGVQKSDYDNYKLAGGGLSPGNRSRHDKLGLSPGNRGRHDNSDQKLSRQNLDGVYLGEEIEACREGESGGGAVGVARDGGRGGLLWLVVALARMDLWKLLLVGGAVGVVFGSVYQGGVGSHFIAGFSSKDNLLSCDSEGSNQLCLTSSEQQVALQLADVAIPYLHKTAGQYKCGMKTMPSTSVSIDTLKRALPEFDSASSSSIQHFIYLILANPEWNIEWQNEKEDKLEGWLRSFHDSDLLMSTAPSLTLKCRIRLTLAFFWSFLRWLLLVMMGVVILMGVALYWHRKRRGEKELMYAMVRKITSILMKHAETVKRKPDLLPYLAIVHVRDLLIPPSERSRKLSVWRKACDYIAKNESRVRVEQQQIAGEEFEVWRWISMEIAANTEEPFDTVDHAQSSASSVKKNGASSSSREKNWYSGTTFDDDSGRNTGHNNRINSPNGSPSECIRLKNMFEYVKNMSVKQIKELEDSVLDRCGPHGGVVHISVDKRSTYGCVYLKMDSLKSAVGAYQALHGGWYKGKLVTAKYIPPAKYYKWFPMATSATVHLKPSSPP